MKRIGWNKQAIIDHKKATGLLGIIKDETFNYLKNNPQVTEFKIQEFVLSRFKNYNLKKDAISKYAYGVEAIFRHNPLSR